MKLERRVEVLERAYAQLIADYINMAGQLTAQKGINEELLEALKKLDTEVFNSPPGAL